jgi:hypothetical protein
MSNLIVIFFLVFVLPHITSPTDKIGKCDKTTLPISTWTLYSTSPQDMMMTLYLTEILNNDDLRVRLVKSEDCFVGFVRMTGDFSVVHGFLGEVSCDNEEETRSGAMEISFAMSSKCCDRIVWAGVSRENPTQMKGIGFRHDMICNSKESMSISFRVLGMSMISCLCEQNESLWISTQSLIHDVCWKDNTKDTTCREMIYSIIYGRVFEDIRNYFQSLEDTLKKRARLNEFIRKMFVRISLDDNILNQNVLTRIVRDKNLSSWLPREIRLRVELMYNLHGHFVDTTATTTTTTTYERLTSKSEEGNEENILLDNNNKKNWTVQVMTDELRLSYDSHTPQSPFVRLLPCSSENDDKNVVFTVLPNGNKDIDQDVVTSSSDEKMALINPKLCVNSSITNITYTCHLDEEDESHVVHFTSKSYETVDAEIYFTHFSYLETHIYRFPGASLGLKEKRPLRIHFQWESTANDNTARQVDWLRHVDAVWSYRSSSDIFAPYRNIDAFLDTLLFVDTTTTTTTTTTNERNKLAVWVQRMCKAHNAREQYVEELMRHIPIDSFGTCLHNTGNRTIPRIPRVSLIRTVSQYKFYLAIENSNCVDYITEKLNTAIESGAVPVVFAPNNVPDYRKILPLGSYINLADFSSAEQAAAYLLRVASDDDLYNSFRWFDKLDIHDRLELKRNLLKRWPTKGTAEESVCQLVQKLKSWHGSRKNDEMPNIYEHTILFPEFVQDKWLERNNRDRLSVANRLLDRSCLPRDVMLDYV